MPTTWVQRDTITTTRGQKLSFRRFKDYLRGKDNTLQVDDVIDHLGRKIVIFSRQGFEEVDYDNRTQRSII